MASTVRLPIVCRRPMRMPHWPRIWPPNIIIWAIHRNGFSWHERMRRRWSQRMSNIVKVSPDEINISTIIDKYIFRRCLHECLYGQEFCLLGYRLIKWLDEWISLFTQGWMFMAQEKLGVELAWRYSWIRLQNPTGSPYRNIKNVECIFHYYQDVRNKCFLVTSGTSK